MVRDLMVACIERQFGISKAAHPVEWLSDNGSAYIAKDTLDTATALGLKLCFTPVRSPESNGIAEAFVKTFKRDYARLSILPDAETVIALLPAWFEDYNEVHPHSLSGLAGIQRHRGGIRQNLQTRLCSAVDLAGC